MRKAPSQLGVRVSRRGAAALGAAIVLLGLVGGGLVHSQSREGAPAQAPLTRTPDGRPLKLTFSEDFDRLRLWNGRSGVWLPMYGDGKDHSLGRRTLLGNRERQIYVDPKFGDVAGSYGLNPFATSKGLLTITANKTDPALVERLKGYRYTSGVITTQPSFSQRYGYFEMRAKAPGGKGVWPAFWMLPKDLSWPPELDIMEMVGNPGKVYMTVHTKTERKKKPKAAEAKITPNEFHVFAASWDPQEVVWYIDGKEVARKPTPPDMHKPMFLIANLAVGGYWPGDPNETTPMPVSYTIDYIRAYRFAP